MWLRLDDQAHRNTKLLNASDSAHRIWYDALSYCADTSEPTGYLSSAEASAFVRARRKRQSVIEELIELNLWEQVPDGYLIHDFEKYLPRTSTERVRAFRERKRNVSETFPKPKGNAGKAFQKRAVTVPHARDNPEPEPVPVPVPEPVPGKAVLKPLTNGQAAAERMRALAEPFLQPKALVQ